VRERERERGIEKDLRGERERGEREKDERGERERGREMRGGERTNK
jgi:hypothetical protein